ncbi:MAG: HD domain-containing protein [Blastocatellia bacterium]|nr:HD domain-containing protein [Blastocatellia bacterium]
MPYLQSVLASIEPLANTLAKTHKVSIVVYRNDGKALLQAGTESPLTIGDTGQHFWQYAQHTEETYFDKIVDSHYVSTAKLYDSNKNTLMLLCMSRSADSLLSDQIHNELLQSLATTVQSCIHFSGAERAAVLELMEKYEELTLLYDISEKLECLPSFEEVANEMLNEAIGRVKCKAGRLVLVNEEDNGYLELVQSKQSIPKSSLSYKDNDTFVSQCLQKPKTQIVSAPVGKDSGLVLTQLHVPVFLKRANPIGVLSLFRKNTSPFKSSDKKIAEMLARQTAGKLESSRLYARLESLFMASIKMLVECIDARDSYTCGHSGRVSYYSVFLAREIGMSEEDVKIVEIGALLHDVGKIRIRDHILNKPGKLDEEERRIIQGHPEFGMRIVEHVKQLHNTVPCIYCHHEHFNGRGYPQRIGGEDIPLMGRIVSIADTFDAMTTTRPYRDALSQQQAYEELLRCSGTQFDPELARVFADAIARGEFLAEKLPQDSQAFKSPTGI